MRTGNQGGSAESGGVEFSSLVLMFGTAALVHLGAAPDPVNGEEKMDLPQAKQMIDLLDLLKVKMAGNLSSGESDMLEDLLYDLRLRYLEAVKRA
jgi:hypothetical protein